MFGSKLFDPAVIGAAVGAAAGGRLGLDVVEEEIGKVITTLQEQRTAIEELDFANAAHIAKGSFGSGNEASLLAVDHAKAHGVIVDTLGAMIADLAGFQDAVIEARSLVRDADDDADLRLRAVLTATESLDLGDRALGDAQVQHSTDVPTDEPAVTSEGGA